MPTLNIDKTARSATSLKTFDTSSGSTTGTTQKSSFYATHPPTVYFLKNTKSVTPDSILTYMLNFIPDSSKNEFGQNNLWTGKLYEWNINVPMVLVQEMSKSIVKNKFVEVLKNPNVSVNSNGIKTNSFWSWLGDLLGGIGSGLEWLAWQMGIPTAYGLDSQCNCLMENGWPSFDWLTGGGGGDSGNSGDGGIGYTGMGSGVYSNYLPGYGGGYYQGAWDPYLTGDGTGNNGQGSTVEISMDATDQDIDDNTSYGNYDNTTYAQFDQQTPWPTVASVLSKSSFVPYVEHSNCFKLAQQQIAVAGYSVSALDAPNQTIQVYTENNGGNLTNAIDAVSYLSSALSRNIPVIVGVDVASGKTVVKQNKDGSTDHYIVIVGMGTDVNGKYFQFFDSSTNVVNLGTSPNNKLYYNATTGLITGKTQAGYGTRASYMHDYILTQVRKSK